MNPLPVRDIADNRIQLPNVTLVGIDGLRAEDTLRSMLECRKHCAFGDSILFGRVDGGVLPFDKFITVRVDINNRAENTQFILRSLYEYVNTEYMMICQHDGYIINPKAWRPEFLKYDYIGAPWWKESTNDVGNVGNGGFSIRSTKLMKLVAENYAGEDGEEDLIICQKLLAKLTDLGCTFAPTSIAREFSWEGDNADYPEYQGSFGFHRRSGRPDVVN